MRHFFGIVLLSIGAAILYGLVHDQITAHLAVEYFSVYHPPVFGGLTDPFLLGLVWGVIATWWVGLLLGVPLAICARAFGGKIPPLTARDLLCPLGILLLCMAVCAFLAGTFGWIDADIDPPARNPVRPPLSAVQWAHNTSYLVGICGGFVLCAATVWRRLKMKDAPLPPNKGGF